MSSLHNNSVNSLGLEGHPRVSGFLVVKGRQILRKIMVTCFGTNNIKNYSSNLPRIFFSLLILPEFCSNIIFSKKKKFFPHHPNHHPHTHTHPFLLHILICLSTFSPQHIKMYVTISFIKADMSIQFFVASPESSRVPGTQRMLNKYRLMLDSLKLFLICSSVFFFEPEFIIDRNCTFLCGTASFCFQP